MALRIPGTPSVGAPSDPHAVRTVDDVIVRLRELRAWAGLGYHEIHRRVVHLRTSRGIHDGLSYNTVYRRMQLGRSRLDVELLVDIVRVLAGEEAAVSWRLAYQVVARRASAAGIVSAPSNPTRLIENAPSRPTATKTALLAVQSAQRVRAGTPG